MQIRNAVILVSLLIVPNLLKAGLNPVTPTQSAVLIGTHLQYFEDPSGKMKITDFLNGNNQYGWQQWNQKIFIKPATNSVWWFKLDVVNPSEKDLWLDLQNILAWYIDWYRIDAQSQITDQHESGAMRETPGNIHVNGCFRFPLNKAFEKDTGHYVFRVKVMGPVELPMYTGTMSQLLEREQELSYFGAGFTGILLVILLYYLFLFISTRELLYLTFAGYLATMFVPAFLNNFPFILKLQLGHPVYWHRSLLIWVTLSNWMISIFAIHSLRLLERIPLLFYLLVGINISLSKMAIFSFFHPANMQIWVYQTLALLQFIICLAGAWIAGFRFEKINRTYAVGWTCLVAGFIIYLLTINGFIPHSMLARHATYIGTGAQIVLFSLALGHRINVLRQEKDQLKEVHYQWVDQQNRFLELQVQERTSELQAQQAEMLRQLEWLKKSNLQKDQLISSIGHDLRGPMKSLYTLFDLSTQGKGSETKIQELAPQISSQLKAMYGTLENVLDWSRTQFNQIRVEQEAVPLKKSLNQMKSLFLSMLNQKNIQLLIQVPDHFQIQIDPNHLSLILRNLLGNAIKFSHPGGTIRAGLFEDEFHAGFFIQDEGIGMTSDQVQQILAGTPGHTSKGTQGEKGTGLGLQLCHEMIRLNRGLLEISSAPGKGTSLLIKFPVANNNSSPD